MVGIMFPADPKKVKKFQKTEIFDIFGRHGSAMCASTPNVRAHELVLWLEDGLMEHLWLKRIASVAAIFRENPGSVFSLNRHFGGPDLCRTVRVRSETYMPRQVLYGPLYEGVLQPFSRRYGRALSR